MPRQSPQDRRARLLEPLMPRGPPLVPRIFPTHPAPGHETLDHHQDRLVVEEELAEREGCVGKRHRGAEEALGHERGDEPQLVQEHLDFEVDAGVSGDIR